MKILYVGAFRFPNYDAAAARVLNNGRIMKECGNEVSFISWGGKYRESDKQPDNRYLIDGMEYLVTHEIDPKGSKWSQLSNLWKRGEVTISLLDQFEIKPDLIVMYNADLRWTNKMVKYCSKYDIKLANDITEWYENNELHFFDYIPYYINMRYTQKIIKNKILISSFLESYYIGTNNIVLPPLCDKGEAKWNKQITDVNIPPFEGVTLIYAGNPAKKDKVHSVIRAVDRLAKEGHHVRFLILGITRELYLMHYRDKLNLQFLHENVLFLGRVSQDLIPAYYKYADFMILLRDVTRKNQAGFPTKFVESFISGTPVIANLTSDLGNYLVDSKTGFVVKEPNETSVYELLKEKVLPLTVEQKKVMKSDVNSTSIKFDYRYHIKTVKVFLDNLE